MKLFKFDEGDGRGKYQTVSLQKPRDPGPETTYDYVIIMVKVGLALLKAGE
jgi:adenine-specific DNA-methyltransferase